MYPDGDELSLEEDPGHDVDEVGDGSEDCRDVDDAVDVGCTATQCVDDDH